jgi:hypothetical protein
MQVVHPTSRQAAEASIASGAYGAQLPAIDDRRAKAARHLAKLAEGE